jgi:hypothetical protein
VRRITFWIMSTIAALVMLFGYRTSLAGPTPATTATAAANAPGIVPGGGAPAPAPSAGSASGAAGAVPVPPENLTVNGSVAITRWGPVQVQVTIAGGRIADVVVLQQPSDNPRDQEINSYALPRLHDEVVRAQSARIDGVSGATVTSDGYRESVQAALDAAHFG